jgi:hypothetical protein
MDKNKILSTELISYIPQDILVHIISFLLKCECCQKTFINDSKVVICSICKRGWCGLCLKEWSYITYRPLKLRMPICKHCHYNNRQPNFCNYTK